MSLISAVTSRGHMRFMIKEKGGVNADVFIEFLRRLIVGAKNNPLDPVPPYSCVTTDHACALSGFAKSGAGGFVLVSAEGINP
jgi:hypothetical protein